MMVSFDFFFGLNYAGYSQEIVTRGFIIPWNIHVHVHVQVGVDNPFNFKRTSWLRFMILKVLVLCLPKSLTTSVI